jgi:hypothetical protein
MTDLKDQLKAWKHEHKDEELRDLKRPAPPKKADPPPRTQSPDEELSDEELFLRAVGKVDDKADAMIAKYDRTDAPPPKDAVKKRKQSKEDADRALFLQFVGEMEPPEDGD